MRGRTVGPVLALPILFLVAPSCVSPKSLGNGFDDEGATHSFTADAAADATDDSDAAEAGNTLTSYCPSNKCPAGWSTCSSSRFPCDVNVNIDPANCGACGVVCPDTLSSSEGYTCADGKCKLTCAVAPPTFDCDGFPDNGCEVHGTTNQNCGGCGIECSDPNKPCMEQPRTSGEFRCGCPPPYISCGAPWPHCVDPKGDDSNCGMCENVCDPTGGGLPAYDHTFYGCVNAKCDKMKCEPFFGDCDSRTDTGCETMLVSNENCGGCGVACPSGSECLINEFGSPECMCGPGEVVCNKQCDGDICTGVCRNLTSDAANCGACNFSCGSNDATFSRGLCTFGICHRQCIQGRADCNGNDADDCEIDTNTDPRNCGACGRVCDAIAGQACVGGECVLEPCEPGKDAGPVAR